MCSNHLRSNRFKLENAHPSNISSTECTFSITQLGLNLLLNILFSIFTCKSCFRNVYKQINVNHIMQINLKSCCE